MVTVLVPTGYSGKFNMPVRSSTHRIVPTRFIGRQQELWRPLGAVAVWRPGNRADVVHTFNGIPISRHRPWMVTFEDYLPRGPGPMGGKIGALLRSRLASPSCGRIIAMSRWAQGVFTHQHRDWKGRPTLLDKTEVLYPAISSVADRPKSYRPGSTLRAVFVGADWATKGAPVAARLAALALQRRVPLEVHVVSSLRFGYADDARREVYEADRQLIIDGPVRYHGPLSNDAVHSLLEESHVLLLPSLGDTFGYVVLEGFAHALPAMVSTTNALPEMVDDGVNGCLLRLDTSELGGWKDLKRGWEFIDPAYSSMAEQALLQVERIVSGDLDYEQLSAGALQRLWDRHDPVLRDKRLEDLYTELASSR